MKSHNTPLGRVFDVFNHIILALIALAMIVPFMYVIAGSFATEAELARRPFFIFPETFTMSAYQYIFSTATFVRSIGVSIFVTVAGTVVSLALTLTMGYALSKARIIGHQFFIYLVIFTIIFQGGMIPTYILVRDLGLLNSLWALIMPIAMNPMWLIIVISFFRTLPRELEESARIDGCTDIGVFWKIALPLSKPIIATFTLFYAVQYWGDYFNALLYISDSTKYPVMLLLQNIMTMADMRFGEVDALIDTPDESLKLAVIVVATIPIMFVYPFLQKHFAKGMLLGSVKG
ncbi:carbohydrate ABC transporter permease [Halalkalibacter sp. APA_J-10(15)]|uniref:carbohydrate ABC transporter permease n=1 Tax=unclassified Halalkalibacter TaxID=2893063 RepID=UPI001FF5FDB7|nr:carbohydrate ABC transporter permease [Halalkalibacter sp. APA_J-10(15)]MCK0473593.1 carbohydrate ABC transporter permease [Halalkalibacter sp. APA_J-10(15)]